MLCLRMSPIPNVNGRKLLFTVQFSTHITSIHPIFCFKLSAFSFVQLIHKFLFLFEYVLEFAQG